VLHVSHNCVSSDLSLGDEKIEMNSLSDRYTLRLVNGEAKTSHTQIEHSREAVAPIAIPKDPQVQWPGDTRSESSRKLLRRKHDVKFLAFQVGM
jgi:hypothetical protein